LKVEGWAAPLGENGKWHMENGKNARAGANSKLENLRFQNPERVIERSAEWPIGRCCPRFIEAARRDGRALPLFEEEEDLRRG
jgi:hypothetical protein